MSITSPALPDYPLPPGLTHAEEWEIDVEGDYRILNGPNRQVTDCDIIVSLWATQLSDGTIDDGSVLGDGPHVALAGSMLNSDQARELASVLLELAAQIDGWVQR